jgi:hypothetical protein
VEYITHILIFKYLMYSTLRNIVVYKDNLDDFKTLQLTENVDTSLRSVLSK